VKTTIPVALETEYQAGTTHIGWLLRLQRRDGVVVALTSHDTDTEIAGLVYKSMGGLDVSATVMRSGLAVDNLEMTTLNNGAIFVEGDIDAGRWETAQWLLSKYNFAAPSDGIEPFMGGTIGNAVIQRDKVSVDMRCMQQYLQQPTVSVVTSKTCRYRLGDEKCTVDLGPFTFAATVTTAGQQVFSASALVQAADYFGNGELLWLTGDNAGIRCQVKEFASAQVTLLFPLFFPVENGDTFDIIAGCRKRHDRTTANPGGVSDCRDKFDNVVNFGGEPHLPGIDVLTKTP
jgi:uncharacterized phage protein (TIGR02218 family)